MNENNETIIETINESNKSSKKNNNIIYIIIIAILIIGFGFYICYDKGIIFKKKTETKKEVKDEIKTQDKTNSTTNNDNSSQDTITINEVNTDTSNYDLSIISKCKDTQYNGFQADLCEINGFRFYVLNNVDEIKVYNANDKLITSYKKMVKGEGSKEIYPAFNADGSVTILTSCLDNIYHVKCYYTRYSYDGKIIVNKDSQNNILVAYDNYMFVLDDNYHLKLKDFKGNYVDSYDIDFSKSTYGGIHDCSGWYVNNSGVNYGIYAKGELMDKSSNEYKDYYYFYNPKTNNVTIKEGMTSEQDGCPLQSEGDIIFK